MMRTILVLLGTLMINQVSAKIKPIEVANLTLKIGAFETKDLYYGFAEGDQIIFNLSEMNGKSIQEVVISELPDRTVFTEYQITNIINQKIQTQQKGIYQFSFENLSIKKRICKIKIQRIPKSEDLIHFNTNWKWKSIHDTSYTTYSIDSLVGHDTIQIPYTKTELVRIDTNYREIHSPENEIWMYSRTNVKACLDKPVNCTKQKIILNYPSDTDYLIVWIGVGQESRDAYNTLSKGFTKLAIQSGSTYLSLGSSLLVNAFKNTATSSLIDNLPTSKNVIDIHFTNSEEANRWYHDSENKIAVHRGLSFKNRVKYKHILPSTTIPKDQMVLCLKNNSYTIGLLVTIDIVAISIHNVFEEKEYFKTELKPKYIRLDKRKMNVQTTQVRVNAE